VRVGLALLDPPYGNCGAHSFSDDQIQATNFHAFLGDVSGALDKMSRSD
jgi:hypothetical protein